MSRSARAAIIVLSIILTVMNGCTLLPEMASTLMPSEEPTVLPTNTVVPLELENTTWLLQLMGEDALAEGMHITIRLTAGVMEGDAGCRAYRGIYHAEGDRISFPMFNLLGETSCADEAHLSQEKLFVDYLDLSSSYKVDDERLEISTTGGVTLIFIPQPAE